MEEEEEEEEKLSTFDVSVFSHPFLTNPLFTCNECRVFCSSESYAFTCIACIRCRQYNFCKRALNKKIVPK